MQLFSYFNDLDFAVLGTFRVVGYVLTFAPSFTLLILRTIALSPYFIVARLAIFLWGLDLRGDFFRLEYIGSGLLNKL